MVELIVVIAIMAILTGALAPALVRYINKSRLSADIDTGKSLATAIMAAVVQDSVRDNAVDYSQPHKVSDMDGQDFKEAVFDILSVDDLKGRATKDVNGDPLDQMFYYTLDPERNKVQVYYGGTGDDYMIYPQTGSKLME